LNGNRLSGQFLLLLATNLLLIQDQRFEMNKLITLLVLGASDEVIGCVGHRCENVGHKNKRR